MAEVHLVVGPVGAGKSTFADDLAVEQRAVHFDLDDWMTRLFRPDRPAADVMTWYVERAARCVEQIWTVSRGLLALGTGVVLEIGLIRRDERRAFCQRVDASGYPLRLYVLDAERDIRRARVVQRNREQGRTFSMEVPMPIFELASDMWQAVDDDEASGREVRFIFTHA